MTRAIAKATTRPTRRITISLRPALITHVGTIAAERGESRDAFITQVLAAVAGARSDAEIERRVERLFNDSP